MTNVADAFGDAKVALAGGAEPKAFFRFTEQIDKLVAIKALDRSHPIETSQGTAQIVSACVMSAKDGTALYAEEVSIFAVTVRADLDEEELNTWVLGQLVKGDRAYFLNALTVEQTTEIATAFNAVKAAGFPENEPVSY